MALEKASWGFMRDKNYDGMKNFLADDALLIFRTARATTSARRSS